MRLYVITQEYRDYSSNDEYTYDIPVHFSHDLHESCEYMIHEQLGWLHFSHVDRHGDCWRVYFFNPSDTYRYHRHHYKVWSVPLPLRGGLPWNSIL
jgi:hypothetical protein